MLSVTGLDSVAATISSTAGLEFCTATSSTVILATSSISCLVSPTPFTDVTLSSVVLSTGSSTSLLSSTSPTTATPVPDTLTSIASTTASPSEVNFSPSASSTNKDSDSSTTALLDFSASSLGIALSSMTKVGSSASFKLDKAIERSSTTEVGSSASFKLDEATLVKTSFFSFSTLSLTSS
ncbi:hypothetical protein RND71_022871 [Anisodus tanguticus]|uniref:Uncharacterized protein n=1 Tax=Anisodus tanguticus TaxID=243964 RepID=A0AAE1RUG9_9SOLA|nr:hypothetical protein RND71_022871 [Anisodus tanguticus]